MSIIEKLKKYEKQQKEIISNAQKEIFNVDCSQYLDAVCWANDYTDKECDRLNVDYDVARFKILTNIMPIAVKRHCEIKKQQNKGE